jgi:hypothetical protein
MALTQFHQASFKTIQRAFANGQVALRECKLRRTGESVAVICAVFPLRGEDVLFIPLAQLFNGNPYDTVEPPVNG